MRRPDEAVNVRQEVRLGRFLEAAMWVLVVLRRGQMTATALLDGVRSVNGPIGPATLLAALARLERLVLIERVPGTRSPAYRLTEQGIAAFAAVGAMLGQPRGRDARRSEEVIAS